MTGRKNVHGKTNLLKKKKLVKEKRRFLFPRLIYNSEIPF